MTKTKIYDVLEKVLVSAIIVLIVGLTFYVIWAYLADANQKQVAQYIFGVVAKLPIGIYLIKKIRDL